MIMIGIVMVIRWICRNRNSFFTAKDRRKEVPPFKILGRYLFLQPIPGRTQFLA